MHSQVKNSSFKLMAMFLSLCLIMSTLSTSFVGFLASADDVVAQAILRLTHTTDVHGSLRSEYDGDTLSVIGCDWLRAIKDKLSVDTDGDGKVSESEQSLLINSGDFMQGTPFVSLKKGLNSIKMMNAARFDVATLGNHEPEFLTETLLNRLKGEKVAIDGYADDPTDETPALDAQVLSANVKYAEGNAYGGTAGDYLTSGIGTNKGKDIPGTGLATDNTKNNGAWTIIERKDSTGTPRKIGVFGLTTNETTVKTAAKNLEGLTFEPELEAAKETVKNFYTDTNGNGEYDVGEPKKVDAVICISHVGMEDATIVKSKDIADAVPIIDVMADGHSHMDINKQYERTDGSKYFISQVRNGSSRVSDIQLAFNASGVDFDNSSVTTVKAKDVKDRYDINEPNADVTALANKLYEPIQEWSKEVIAAVEGELYGPGYNDNSNVGKGFECNGAEFLAEMYQKAVKHEIDTNSALSKYKDYKIVATQNAGGYRKTLKGLISNGSLYNSDPMPNDINSFVVSPKELKDILECSFAQVNVDSTGKHLTMSDAFGQPAGMTIHWDVTKEARKLNSDDASTVEALSARANTGNRVVSITLDGDNKPLDLTDDKPSIIFVCHSYLATGGNNYEGIKLINLKTGKDDRHVVELSNEFETLKAQILRELAANKGAFFKTKVNNGRIVLDSDVLERYDATFTAKDNGEVLKEGTKLTVTVEKSDPAEEKAEDVSVEANGKFTIKDMDPGINGYTVTYTKDNGDTMSAKLMTSNMWDPANTELQPVLTDITFDFKDYVFDKDVVKSLLEKLPTTISNVDQITQIQFARNAYEALIASDKATVDTALVTKLETAEAACITYVTGLIDKLPTEIKTVADIANVTTARNAYDALTEDAQKNIDTKLPTLEGAETACKTFVEGLINALPEKATDIKSVEDITAVNTARDAYEALSTTVKNTIDSTTVKKLEDAEAACTAYVTDLLTKLPATVATADDVAKVKEARNAYEALSATAKATVSSELIEKLQTAEISAYKATLSQTEYTYTGSEITPDVTLKDNDKALVKGTDFNVTYANNKNAGTARVNVSGKGEYNFNFTLTFTITPKALEEDKVTLAEKSVVYNGTAQQPTVTIAGLAQGTDFTVAYANNTDVGTATVTVTGINNYQGTVTKNFTITAKELDATQVKLSKTSFVYNGKAQSPTVTIKDLKQDTDFTVACTNNTNAGKATVTVKGKNNYQGTVTKNFTITAKALVATQVVLSKKSFTYNKKAQKPAVTINGLAQGKDYTVAYANNTNAGKATVTVTGINNYQGTVKPTFTINKKALKAKQATLSKKSFVFNGKARKPKVKIKGLKKGTDFTVKYSKNKKVGKAIVTITGKNNYKGTIKKYFKITKSKAKKSKNAKSKPAKSKTKKSSKKKKK